MRKAAFLWVLAALMFFIMALLNDGAKARAMNVVAGVLFLIVAFMFNRSRVRTN